MSQDHRTCIVCGRPTNGPVVCYRCFFDYDHRLYEKEKDVKPAPMPRKHIAPKLKCNESRMNEGDSTDVSDRYVSPHKPTCRFHKKQTQLLQLPTRSIGKNGNGFLSRLGLF